MNRRQQAEWETIGLDLAQLIARITQDIRELLVQVGRGNDLLVAYDLELVINAVDGDDYIITGRNIHHFVNRGSLLERSDEESRKQIIVALHIQRLAALIIQIELIIDDALTKSQCPDDQLARFTQRIFFAAIIENASGGKLRTVDRRVSSVLGPVAVLAAREELSDALFVARNIEEPGPQPAEQQK